MKKWFAAWCGLTAACAMTTSCSMMQDDLDDCPTGLYLSFKYDYNLQRADMFNDHVGAVTVYVFWWNSVPDASPSLGNSPLSFSTTMA